MRRIRIYMLGFLVILSHAVPLLMLVSVCILKALITSKRTNIKWSLCHIFYVCIYDRRSEWLMNYAFPVDQKSVGLRSVHSITKKRALVTIPRLIHQSQVQINSFAICSWWFSISFVSSYFCSFTKLSSLYRRLCPSKCQFTLSVTCQFRISTVRSVRRICDNGSIYVHVTMSLCRTRHGRHWNTVTCITNRTTHTYPAHWTDGTDTELTRHW
jgi:hypothetical protein